MALPTVVTAFFDLSKRDPTRPTRNYLELGKFVLGLPNPIVLFTDVDDLEDIIACRQDKPLHIIKMRFEELPWYSYYDKISVITTRNYTNSKNTVDYVLFTWSKLCFMSTAIQHNYHKTSHFIWIDFGIAHVAVTDNVEKDRLFELQFDKIKICQMRYLNLEFVYSDYYLQNFLGVVAGGFISGPADKISIMYKAFQTTILYLLSINYCPLEEAVWGILTVIYPGLFDTYYSDYRHMLNNVIEYRGDEHIIQNVINQATVYNDTKFISRVHAFIKKLE